MEYHNLAQYDFGPFLWNLAALHAYVLFGRCLDASEIGLRVAFDTLSIQMSADLQSTPERGREIFLKQDAPF